MKNRLSIGITFIVLGLLIAIGPFTLFPVCEVMDDMIMKCHWTAQAELGIGLGIAVLGVLSLVFASKEVRLGLSIAVLLNGILSLLVETALIGMCANPAEPCRLLTQPALSVLGGVLVVAAAIQSVYLWKTNHA
jgi:hypothetical protein